MVYSNVSLWFAKDDKEQIITIDKVNKEDYKKYYCPICGSEVTPKMGEVNSWHFAHLDSSKCNSETQIHWWFKNKLIIKGDRFIINTDIEKEYTCKEILVEESYVTEYGEYKPDLTIITECGNTIYFEMNYSNNKTPEDYLDKWTELGNVVVEIDIKTLMSMESIKLANLKALFDGSQCLNVKKGDIYYDTIGKHKEKKLSEPITEKIKLDLIKLDWFWNEIKDYKHGNKLIDDIVFFIDESENIELIYKILVKTKCIDIKNHYETYKINKYKEEVKKRIKYDYANYGVELVIGKNGVSKRIRLEYKDRWGDIRECLNQYLWNNFTFDDKECERLQIIIVKRIYESNMDNLCKERWVKVKETISIISTMQRNDDFNITYEYLKEETKIKIYIESDVMLKKNIIEITHREINNTSYNILRDDIEDFIKDYIIELTQEFCLLGISEIRNWKLKKEQYMKFQDTLLKILNTNADIVEVIPNYMNENLIYFSNSKGLKSIVYTQNVDLKYCNKQMDIKFDSDINMICIYNGYLLDRYSNYGFYLILENGRYTLKEYIKGKEFMISPRYVYKANIFKGKEILLTFDARRNYKRLDRFDFIKCQTAIHNIVENEIAPLREKYNDDFVATVIKNTIIDKDVDYIINSENIDNLIIKCLYPIYFLSHASGDTLEICLNCIFTKSEYGKFRPWLVNEFIEELNFIGINADNII